MQNTDTLHLDVVSDTICPWCWIGKRRLDAALASIGDELCFEVRWRPFELNPDMPREGVERRAYRTRKFGSWERSLELDAQVRASGAEDGLDFRHELATRTPNTLASHALVALAAVGRQGDVVEALFAAYFGEGRDVGDPSVLRDIGAAHGLDPAKIDAALADDALRAALHEEARRSSRAGIGGVPTVLLNGYRLFSGAQPPAAIEAALREAAAHDEVLAAGRA